MAAQMSKSQLIEKLATTTELSKRDVKGVMEALTDVGHKELKKSGVFLLFADLDGLSVRIVEHDAPSTLVRAVHTEDCPVVLPGQPRTEKPC